MADRNSNFGDDTSPNTRGIYCYVIQQADIADAPPLFLTSYDGEILMSGLPAGYGADTVQVFSPANITHGAIKREGTYDKSTFQIHALTRDISGISRYALTGAVPHIQISILKCNAGPVDNMETLVYSADVRVVESGAMISFGFQGFQVTADCCPLTLVSAQEVPRCRFSRTCNRQLYGIGCFVDRAAFSMASNILEVDPGARSLLVQGVRDGDIGNFFRLGVLKHQKTGLRLSVAGNTIEGGNTRIRLQQWCPDMDISDVVDISAGCDRTFPTCLGKFDNAPNYGGFSQVPNVNATIQGVQ